jgi:hypothetical protein
MGSAKVGEVVVGLLGEPGFGLPPKTLERRTAISGEMPRFPLTSSESVVRVTLKAAAWRVGHPLLAEKILILSFSLGCPILAGFGFARVGLSFS